MKESISFPLQKRKREILYFLDFVIAKNGVLVKINTNFYLQYIYIYYILSKLILIFIYLYIYLSI